METVIKISENQLNEVVEAPGQPLAVAPVREEPLVQVSGARKALREIGAAVGWITWPVWRPMLGAVRIATADARRIAAAPRLALAHAKAWRDLAVASARRWDAWTQAERASVVRQQAVWAVLMLVVVAFLAIGEGWAAFAPMLLLSALWWLRSHATRLRWHWDVVRWALGLPQVPEQVLRGEEVADGN